MNSPSFDQFSQIIADVMTAVRNSKATELTSEEIAIMRFIVNGIVPSGTEYYATAPASGEWFDGAGLYTTDGTPTKIWAAPSGFVPAQTEEPSSEEEPEEEPTL